MTGSEIREKFLEFFAHYGHTIKESASLIPSDATVLFTIAGMVPFKPYFLGEIDPLPFTRAASSQRCLRTNDIENVGRTARHHTFFEMLGNFSFGDYFKKDAIAMAWEFLTKVVELPTDKLWVSIYKEDNEADEIWRQFIQSQRIIRLGEDSNFWKMGETGPCGPCSEILYDQGEEVGCGKPTCQVGCDCDRYLELWNLVFTQFDRDNQGNMHPLPKKNIDTGMGLERLTAVLQGVRSNFDCDLLKGIINAASNLAKLSYGQSEKTDVALRIIADHLRAVTFLVYDGVLPSNEGRGYVLRSLIRRAVRQGKLIGLNETFLYSLVASAVKLFSLPGLTKEREHISRIIKIEEERFIETLERGLAILEEVVTTTKKKGQSVISGSDAFCLYDTYGFPLDLTKELAEESGLRVDEAGFNEAMEQQRCRARAAGLGTVQPEMAAGFIIEKETRFVGYDSYEAEAEVIDIIKNKELVTKAEQGDKVEIILNASPFYAESGGQVGDSGRLQNDYTSLEVITTQRSIIGKTIVHQAKVLKGQINLGDKLKALIDLPQRRAIERNHTATHLLQASLRQVMGKHVKQAGSLVTPDYLRFDFTHLEPMKKWEIKRVEELINEKVRDSLQVATFITSIQEAKGLGAMALFDQEYGQEVRVVKIEEFSLELCAGTHLQNTGQIGLFKLLNETGVAAGIRRIEALTGLAAYNYICQQEEMIEGIAQLLKAPRDKLIERIERLNQELKDQEKEIKQLNNQLMLTKVGQFIQTAVQLKDIKVIAQRIEGLDMDLLRGMADLIMDRLRSGVVILGTVLNDKVFWVIKVSQDLTKIFHAGQLIARIASITEGNGGGKPEIAQAGGKNPAKLDEALTKAVQICNTIIDKEGKL